MGQLKRARKRCDVDERVEDYTRERERERKREIEIGKEYMKEIDTDRER